MKTIKVIVAVLISSVMFSFCSAGEKVPQKVKDAFAKKFPTAKSVKWDKESANEWEAEFKMNKMEYSANFSEDGIWKETEHEISENDLPESVKKALADGFPSFKTEEMEISETTSGTVYEFEIEKDETDMEVAIDASGKITKQEMKKEESNKDDKD
ncbi:PepSY-like domain-containing protein [Aequorivita nionensis]|uniref:PepSY-like domain-containing protein n=1 Tax=Aequorivita nionensis TaxID=1287690 RepID=UPI003965B9EB